MKSKDFTCRKAAPPMERPLRAVIYARYSTNRQREESIAAQVRACREYAIMKGIEIVEVYADEAISGKGSKTASRVRYQRMLRELAKGGIDIVLVHTYDRVARNVGEHVNLESRLNGWGVSLVAVSQDFGTSKEAKVMRTMMWALSEYYIDNLSEEVQKGHKETAYEGLHNGGYAPFGYDVVDQRYVVNPVEAGFVKKIFDAAAARQGFKAIIKELADAGITGKRGKSIKYPQIYEILRNEKYTGLYSYSPQEEKNRGARRDKPNAIKKENALPVIIDRAQFEEVRQIMKERKQTGAKRGYLCSGLVYCTCGAKMHAISPTRKGITYHYYTCSAKCGFGVVKMEDVDNAAIDYLHTLLSPANQDRIAAALRSYSAGERDRAEEFNAGIRHDIAERQKQYDSLMESLASGTLPPEIMADVGMKMKKIKEEISALQEVTPPKDFTVPQIKEWLDALKAASDEQAVHLLIERIDVKDKTAFDMQSTLNTVLGKIGCGGRI